MSSSKEELQRLEVFENVKDGHDMDIPSDVEEYSQPTTEDPASNSATSPSIAAAQSRRMFSLENFHCMKKGIIMTLFLVAMMWVLIDDYRIRREQHISKQQAPPPPAKIVIAPPAVSPDSSTLLPDDHHDDDDDDSNSLIEDTTTNSTDDFPATKNPAPSLSPLLPKRIYSVIGLEDSGTQFVSRLIRDALGISQYREGSFPCFNSRTKRNQCSESLDVQVQHFSLPWGSTCQANPNPPVVDVVLPSQCTRTQRTDQERDECREMVNSIWGFEKNDKRAIKYPARYQLDIVSHKSWYDAQGVEQFFVIVVRDQKISFVARTKHCSNPKLRQEEEDVGTDIIVDAINTFILNKNSSSHQNVTRETYQYWAAQQFQYQHGGHKHRRKLSALPFGNNVVVVSYESLVKLGKTYVEMLYEVLGIDSDYFPEILNSNEKYVMDDASVGH
jgi:hypothetical protein